MVQSSLKLTYLGSEILCVDSVLQIFCPLLWQKDAPSLPCPHVCNFSLRNPTTELVPNTEQKKVGCFVCFPFLFLWSCVVFPPYFALFFSNLDTLKYKWKLMVVSELSNILDSFAQNNCLFLFILSHCLKNNNTSSPLNLWTFPGYHLVS